jgi:hypothetical protein
MTISLDLSALGKTKWYEYALRFAFGGAITVAAGLIANKWGPGLGGLFLAFPVIFPASATLVEKHAKQEKQQHGLDGTIRGREAAGLDAAGAAIGSIGLIAFAVAIRRLMPLLSTWLVMICATLAWLITSVVIWYLRRREGGSEGVASAIVPSIPSRTVSQRMRYATMRFAQSRLLPACSAKLFSHVPPFPPRVHALWPAPSRGPSSNRLP